MLDIRPRDSGQSIEDATKRGDVSFSQQFAALYRQFAVPPDEAARWQEIYTNARAVFEQRHGGLRRSWYADGFAAGVAFTGDGQLHEDVWFDTLQHYDIAEASELWTELRTLHERIGLYLEQHPRDREVCLHALFDLFTALIAAMKVEWMMHGEEGDRTPTEQFRKSIGQISAQRDALEVRYLSFARAHAQRRYLAGAALGTLAMAALVGFVWLILYVTDTQVFHWVPVMAAGAVGALLSVLQRNASGTLNVLVEAEPKDLTIGGMTRPAVGVLSALAVYVLVEAELVPLALPDGDADQRFFFAGVGFLAGFSERFVKDAFGAAEGAAAP